MVALVKEALKAGKAVKITSAYNANSFQKTFLKTEKKWRKDIYVLRILR